VKIAGAVTEGSGTNNEDGLGFLGDADNISAAWVFDGVTGINDHEVASTGTDAQWIVARAHHHLTELAGTSEPLTAILAALVDRLITDWTAISAGHILPPDFDPPATCLLLVKRYADGWQALRLGDSVLLAQHAGQGVTAFAPGTDGDLWLATAAAKRRAAGVTDPKVLRDGFRAELYANRQRRNREGGYGILEAAPAAKHFAEVIELGHPEKILLCTDGFYRAVDHYALFTPSSLLDAASNNDGVQSILSQIRATESADSDCTRFPRLKPADDATALCLVVQ
jgi:serine/threonine protein phosphatase PrpC